MNNKFLLELVKNNIPNFYMKIFINDIEFTSTVWSDTKYIYDPQWSATLNVPDDQESVTIKIQLWSENMLYDLSSDRDSYDVTLLYSIKTGHWTGDDSLGDCSGYGRLNGCDDGSYNRNERDCEVWFTILQTDPDGDGIHYWTEVYTYGTVAENGHLGPLPPLIH